MFLGIGFICLLFFSSPCYDIHDGETLWQSELLVHVLLLRHLLPLRLLRHLPLNKVKLQGATHSLHVQPLRTGHIFEVEAVLNTG